MINQELENMLSNIYKTKLKLVQWKFIFNSIYDQLIECFSNTNKKIIDYYHQKASQIEVSNSNMFSLLNGWGYTSMDSQNIVAEYLTIEQDCKEIERFLTQVQKLVMQGWSSVLLTGDISKIRPTNENHDPYIPGISPVMYFVGKHPGSSKNYYLFD